MVAKNSSLLNMHDFHVSSYKFINFNFYSINYSKRNGLDSLTSLLNFQSFLHFNGSLRQKSPLRVNWLFCPLTVWSIFLIALGYFLNPNSIIWAGSIFFSVIFTLSLASQLSLSLRCPRVLYEISAATELVVTSQFGHPSPGPQLI